jgi:hypothetical protein
MSGLRLAGGILIVLGATFAVFTTVITIDQLDSNGSVNHGRAIAWLIGAGLYAMIVGAVLVILDSGHRR